MELRERLDAWQEDEITNALLGDIEGTIERLEEALVYEKDETEIRIMQGLVRAYIDVREEIITGAFFSGKESITREENEDD